MQLKELTIRNYRTIEDLTLKFNTYYTAICGRNDAGKTNIVRALQTTFQTQSKFFYISSGGISLEEDLPLWCAKDNPSENRTIAFDFLLLITREDDEGLYLFLQQYLKLEDDKLLQPSYLIRLGFQYIPGESSERIAVALDGSPLETLKAQEVWKRIHSAAGVLFHDSTEFFHPFRFRESADLFKEISPSDRESLASAQANVRKVFSRVAKKNQQELTEMLGRLSEKYKIGVTLGKTDNSEVPYTISLSTQDGEVELEKWGNGTQNRTRILMTLFKAKRVKEGSNSSEKVTPLLIIEEPESYLHPSAQAEFGLTLRDLAEEFRIQVVVTTHSPYLLSLSQPNANMLLERAIVKKRAKETRLVDTSGDKWAEPFSLALGVSSTELKPWKDALFSGSDAVLLVEGETDKDYLTLLLDEVHGDDALKFRGTIFPYEGKDSIKQKSLLKFIRSRFKTSLITFDLDVESELQPYLTSMGLLKNKDFLAIGRDIPGRRSIEGLLPDAIFQEVFSSNPDLVLKMAGGSSPEARSAKSALKKLYLSKFKEKAVPGTDAYKGLYSLAKQLNKLIADKERRSEDACAA